MSLLDEMMFTCAFMTKTKASDGEGGFTNVWTQGEEFEGAIVIENSTLAIVADSQRQNRTYKITVKKSVVLDKGDVIKRLSDGAIFKITSDSNDVLSPSISTIDIAQVTAERWELT